MQILNESYNTRQALAAIKAKDWMRARTINPAKIDAMFRAITDEEKRVGRSLAFFFYFYLINPSMFDNPAHKFLQPLVDRLIISEDTYNDLVRIARENPSYLLPYCEDEQVNASLRSIQTRINDRREHTSDGIFSFFENLNETFALEYLDDLENTVRKSLADNHIYPEDLFIREVNDNLELFITISGDWKHDHLLANELVKDVLQNVNLEIVDFEEEVIGSPDSDYYDAIHMWKLKEVAANNTSFFDEEFNSDILTETYSQEELDNMIGKVYNQQKILNIYRRQKYNDKRLFAHTKCIDCAREKRVFLSNLVTNPEKYGSCICSDKNVESRLDNIEDLYDGSKKLSSNTSGYTGVSYIKAHGDEQNGKWRAYIEVDGKRTYLGDFNTKSSAVRAREKAAKKGLKWYKDHKNEFFKDYRKHSKRYRSKRTGRKR